MLHLTEPKRLVLDARAIYPCRRKNINNEPAPPSLLSEKRRKTENAGFTVTKRRERLLQTEMVTESVDS